MLNQHFIANIVEWIEKGTLIGDPSLVGPRDLTYGQGTLAVTTIMKEGLIPPVYIGTQIGTKSMQTLRTVYRGGGLISVINQFAKNRVALGPTAGPHLRGMRFEDLPEEAQRKFLSYSVPVFEIQQPNGFTIKYALRKVDLIRQIPD